MFHFSDHKVTEQCNDTPAGVWLWYWSNSNPSGRRRHRCRSAVSRFLPLRTFILRINPEKADRKEHMFKNSYTCAYLSFDYNDARRFTAYTAAAALLEIGVMLTYVSLSCFNIHWTPTSASTPSYGIIFPAWAWQTSNHV